MKNLESRRSLFTPEHAAEAAFWILAAVLLFLNLGMKNISGSEGRWAEIVREMFISGDFLHPTINFRPYFDKPLISYWIIAGCTLPFGEVSELLIRIPSAVAGLFSLWGTRLIASRFGGKTCGVIAGWIMLTVYSFAWWGRLGEADMLNMAFGTMAVGWYVIKRNETGFFNYLLFGLLCAVGGQTKGLSAIAVPVLAVLADQILSRGWKRHLNWKLIAAGIVSLLAYLLPFLLAAKSGGDYSANGLELVFRENILRYFDAFDHRQPWYAYFIHLPQLFLPWTPFLILALIAAIRNWRKAGNDDRWLLVSIAVIFLVFSISESKRIYYILPILPFCAVLTARFIQENAAGLPEKIRNVLLRIYVWVLPAAALLMMLSPAVWLAVKDRIPFELPALYSVWLCGTLFLGGLLMLTVTLVLRSIFSRNAAPENAHGRNFAVCAVSFAILFIAVFGMIIPVTDVSFRTAKPFIAEIRDFIAENSIPPERIFYFYKNYVDSTFYLGLKQNIRILDYVEDGQASCQELKQLLRENPDRPFLVLGQPRHFQKIPDPELRELVMRNLIREPSYPWEKKKNADKGYAVFTLMKTENAGN